MWRLSSIGLLMGLVAIFMVAFPVYASGIDVITLTGESLTDDEMAQAQGGFSFSNGDFMYFTVETMRLDFLSNSSFEASNSSTWVSGLTQEAHISSDGIHFNLELLQGGNNPANDGEPNAQADSVLQPSQLDIIQLNNVFNDFNGLANVNFIAGNHNIASNVNIINVEINILKASEAANVRLPEFFLY